MFKDGHFTHLKVCLPLGGHLQIGVFVYTSITPCPIWIIIRRRRGVIYSLPFA